ncbi:MAG: PAS domain-containing protein, partial [Thermodesulfobacteriota bacterium]|nr:PAS domain-containing protein [Thermodesulfobacteriota bacterium]
MSQIKNQQHEDTLYIDYKELMRLFDVLEAGVYVINEQYKIEYINSIVQKDFGIVGKRKCYEYLYDRSEVCPWCRNQEVLAGKSVRWMGALFKNNRYYDILNTPLKNADGTIFMLKIFHDITERKKDEEELRLSEERYALAQRAANIGSWDLDLRTNVLKWSERIEPMFGFRQGQFGATYESFLECVHPEDRQYVIDSINACIYNGKEYAIEHRIIWQDGTIRRVSETGDAICNENGEAIRMLGVVQDITKRKEAEEILEKVMMELERSNQELQQFAYVVSHDLQEPLRMITSYTQLLKRRYADKLDSDANDFIQFAVDGAIRMQNLIHDLLAYSRVGARSASFELTDCNAILEQVITDMQVAIDES